MNILEKMENLKVLYLKGNLITRSIKNYRKFLIYKLKALTYLDDRPVDGGDRAGSEAFFQGGLEMERKVREEFRKSKDTGYKIRKMQEDKINENFNERKEKAIIALKNEYMKKKEYLDNKKKKLLKEYKLYPEKKYELYKEIQAVDYQIKENDKYILQEEKDIIFSMAKREKLNLNSYAVFEYEDWMNSILVNNVVENMFDFSIALKLIHLELKNRNTPNYELFNELELRNRWTDIELKFFRKEKEESKNSNFDKEKNNTNNINNINIEIEAEKDKRIIIDIIKEKEINENLFNESISNPVEFEFDKKNENNNNDKNILEIKLKKLKNNNINNSEENIKNPNNDNNNLEESKGKMLEIKEANIDFDDLD
jgi:hypothetical protein